MRIELKEFQDDAVRQLIQEVVLSRQEITLGRPQAVVLSSPTGSGKTVIMTSLMERLWTGHEALDPDPDAVFLWISDSPELNRQSKEKIEAVSDVFSRSQLLIIDNDYDSEVLAPACVYFLNTQKLSQSSLLTKQGDMRAWTIWQTIQNTAKASPDHFCLIIDEAHRGMALTARVEEQILSIIQRFIKGSSEVGLSPVPLVIGMSATPQRFNRVLEGANRIRRPVDVSADAVRASGLIKDRIILDIAEREQFVDWTLLSDAGKRTIQYATEWKEYCSTQGIVPPVQPVLVVQVEDGTERLLTRTDLPKAVQVLEREFGTLGEGELAHCFQEEGDVLANGHIIRKIDASKIQADPVVRVVFFKMALSTGWDCPRAEVMMSFRRAKDHTLIAQLIGRMVRTPLARRVDENEFLGSVALFLPHYSEEGLNAIIDHLENPDTGSPAKVERAKDIVLCRRAPDKTDLFRALSSVPTYVLDGTRRQANTRRLLKLGRFLTFDGVDLNAWKESKAVAVDALASQARRLRKNPEFGANINGKATISIKEFRVEFGELHEVNSPQVVKVEVSPENIADLFQQCERTLGEGIKDEYWRRFHDRNEPDRAKLELFCVLQDPAALRAVQTACGKKIDELFDRYRDEIYALPSGRREQYQRIGRQGEELWPDGIIAPDQIDVHKEKPIWEGHLYVDISGRFGWKANTWEEQVLREEMKGKSFAGWLRNIPKRTWSLCVPYGQGVPKAMYPDLLLFRRESGKVKIDILDPHDDSRGDAAEKAVGLANFARKHTGAFGRIELIRIAKGRIERLRLHQESVRDKVVAVSDLKHLQELYASLA